jgi:hypothetical protein
MTSIFEDGDDNVPKGTGKKEPDMEELKRIWTREKEKESEGLEQEALENAGKVFAQPTGARSPSKSTPHPARTFKKPGAPAIDKISKNLFGGGGRRKTRKKKGSDYSKIAKNLMKQRAAAAAKGDIGRFKGDDFDSKLLHIAEGKAEMDKLKRIHREGHGNIDPETGLAVAPRVPRMIAKHTYDRGLAAKRKRKEAKDEAPAAKRIRKITYNGGKRRKKTRKKRKKKKRKTKKRRKRKKRKTKKRYRNQRGCNR